MDNVTAKWDATNDKVVVYGGNDYQNCGDFKVSKLSADGKTTVSEAGHIDRGYEKIEQILSSVGADIIRKS